jgi:hypothetical protein
MHYLCRTGPFLEDSDGCFKLCICLCPYAHPLQSCHAFNHRVPGVELEVWGMNGLRAEPVVDALDYEDLKEDYMWF